MPKADMHLQVRCVSCACEPTQLLQTRLSLDCSRFSRDELSSLQAGFDKICGPEHTLDKQTFLVNLNMTKD